MVNGVIKGYVAGPALVICAYNSCIVTSDNYAAAMEILICED